MIIKVLARENKTKSPGAENGETGRYHIKIGKTFFVEKISAVSQTQNDPSNISVNENASLINHALTSPRRRITS